MKDVARSAGVSTATVSRVINGIGSVSGEVRSRVLFAIERLDYSPNAVAAQLSRNGGQPRRRLRRTRQSSADEEQGDPERRESPINPGKDALEVENEALKRTVRNLVRELVRLKARSDYYGP